MKNYDKNKKMNYEIVRTDDFDREVKRLSKKYRSFLDDLEDFKNELLENPTMGDNLGNNVRKVRMAITSKGKGKSGGARVITCNVLVNFDNAEIYLLTIYDKNEQQSISKEEIARLRAINGIVDN